MIAITYITFFVMLVLCGVFQLWAYQRRKDVSVGNNPQFLKFQRGYFAAYLMAVFADWLQGPYLYKLYSYYGYQEAQIATLYAVGFASTVILGTWTPIAADQFGRKKLCLLFTVLYSVSCLMKLCPQYGILLLGRVIGGIATSVLFSAFEAWYIHEHLETHDFPKEWISVTFAKASLWNGVLAVVAGVAANIISEGFGLGPVAPYMLAIPFLIFSGIIVFTHWTENYSLNKVKFKKLCGEGFRMIVTKEEIFMLGAIEALFESVIYIVIFLWTPILQAGSPSLGIVFSSFMASILVGQGFFNVVSTTRHFRPSVLLMLSISMATVANFILIISTHPDKRDISMSFSAFTLFEVAVGLYFPAMGYLRSRIIPDTHRWGVINWFRVPINLIACVVLMLLHEDVFQHGNRMIFVLCFILLIVTLAIGARFLKVTKDDERLRQEAAWLESDHIYNIF